MSLRNRGSGGGGGASRLTSVSVGGGLLKIPSRGSAGVGSPARQAWRKAEGQSAQEGAGEVGGGGVLEIRKTKKK